MTFRRKEHPVRPHKLDALATDTSRAVGIVNKHDTELESQLQHLTDHDRKIAAQEQRIAELERQLQAQATQIASLLEQIQAGNRPRAAHRQRTTTTEAGDNEATDHAGLAELESGLVSAAEFAKAHGINVGTAKSAYQSGRIPTIHGKWRGPSRGAITVALDAEGRARFHELYSGSPDFIQACPDCPHTPGH